MSSLSTPSSSPKHQLIPLIAQPTSTWQLILQASNQVVLYNPTNHALTVTPAPKHSPTATGTAACPYCHRPFTDAHPIMQEDEDPTHHARTSDYFQLLAVANESLSRPSTPPDSPSSSTFKPEAMADGYFNAFFREECKLGMGANGSVFLCQHVLDGNPLGHFAVKKIAVGESHSYLLDILREVRLLESLRHPHIVTYHHSWLETTQFSPFGPRIPTLHVLMQWAEGGSLDDLIDARLGIPSSRQESSHEHDQMSRSARIKAFKQNRAQGKANIQRARSSHQQWTAVHLFSAEEVKSLFADVVEGLAFLHERSILHLDLKPGNVLLTWDEGRLIPRAMLSDFGTSRDMLNSRTTRSGNTGTLEYCSPESLPAPHTGILQSLDSKSDMWSLGMVLHKMLFFRLPYEEIEGIDPNSRLKDKERDRLQRLESAVASYRGFKSTALQATTFATRRLPRAFLVLLETLLNPLPSMRPSCERVVHAIREGRLDPIQQPSTEKHAELVPIIRRRSSSNLHAAAQSNPPAPTQANEEKKGTSRDESDDYYQPKAQFEGEGGNPVSRVTTTFVGANGRLEWRRAVKSCVLMFKLMSLTGCISWNQSLSSSNGMPTGNRLVWTGLIALAVADTLVDRMDVCTTLAAAHIVLLRFVS